VLCSNPDPRTNGGAHCDHAFAWGVGPGSMRLDAADGIELLLDGMSIDRVRYSAAPPGAALSLDPNVHDAAANDIEANWCPAPEPFGDGDRGSPGLPNPACGPGPRPLSVWPEDGVDNGGETITIRGEGFTGTTGVFMGESSCLRFLTLNDQTIECLTPAHFAAEVDVVVHKGAARGRLARGYRFTGEAVRNLNWCDLQWPSAATASVGQASETLYGQVRSPGVTEAAGEPQGILAQVGWGPQGSDPRNEPGWLWTRAVWHRQYWENDEYRGALTVSRAGVYSLVYRFSDDGGLNFMYCDFDPGTADGFTTGRMGTLTVR
jgi:hypothetical protein